MEKNKPAKPLVSRRRFIQTSGAVMGLAAWTGAASVAGAEGKDTPARGLIRPGDVVLFQGDSITDMGRSRKKADIPNRQVALGNGYAWLAAAELLVDRPHDGLKIYNRGISGNKVFQLAARWQTDCLDLKPDVLSILVGVNDYWHTIDPRIHYKGTVEIYERDYRALIRRTLKALPHVKLVLCEPYVLRCGVVNEHWFPDFDHYRAAARRVAETFHATFVPFQAMFDQAVHYAPPNHWTRDGVHPTWAGASLMAYNWLKVVNGAKGVVRG